MKPTKEMINECTTWKVCPTCETNKKTVWFSKRGNKLKSRCKECDAVFNKADRNKEKAKKPVEPIKIEKKVLSNEMNEAVDNIIAEMDRAEKKLEPKKPEPIQYPAWTNNDTIISIIGFILILIIGFDWAIESNIDFSWYFITWDNMLNDIFPNWK